MSATSVLTVAVRWLTILSMAALVPGFQYDPSLNWKSWTSWNKKGADDLGRSFNYPHVVSTYWSLYRVARNSAPAMSGSPLRFAISSTPDRPTGTGG